MSRTDKDQPYWVDAWWVPRHFRCPHVRYARTERDCDLPLEPPRGRPVLLRRIVGCYWEVQGGVGGYGGAPGWFVNEVWTAPTRQTARVECDRARAEYRAMGEVETIPATWQHRHGAAWLYW